eukprot:Lithocolla_globosa_v1_NODE_2431_length_2010_cov_25.169821.p2 type:complete len:152 gc:universal NODE_2431_length_2010_cov_25.169821:385-840(+)
MGANLHESFHRILASWLFHRCGVVFRVIWCVAHRIRLGNPYVKKCEWLAPPESYGSNVGPCSVFPFGRFQSERFTRKWSKFGLSSYVTTSCFFHFLRCVENYVILNLALKSAKLARVCMLSVKGFSTSTLFRQSGNWLIVAHTTVSKKSCC